jgi:hypothetical protein
MNAAFCVIECSECDWKETAWADTPDHSEFQAVQLFFQHSDEVGHSEDVRWKVNA